MKVLLVYDRRGLKLPDKAGALQISDAMQTEARFHLVETMEMIASHCVRGEIVAEHCDKEGQFSVNDTSACVSSKVAAALGPLMLETESIESQIGLPIFFADWGCSDFLEILLDYTDAAAGVRRAAQDGNNALIDILETLLRSEAVERVLICSHQFEGVDRTAVLHEQEKEWLERYEEPGEVVRLTWLTSWNLDSLTHIKEQSLLIDNMHRAASTDLDIHRFDARSPHKHLWDSGRPLAERIDGVFNRLWEGAPSRISPPEPIK